ncbi:MAG: DUF3347 domain-containing protein [Reichenbachiella sp.]
MKNSILIGCLFLAACNNQPNTTTNQTSTSIEPTATEIEKVKETGIETEPSSTLKFKSKGIQNIYSTYSMLRDALVATDFDTAKKYAIQLKTMFEKEDKWQEASIAASIKDATEIGMAREAFYNLNTAFEALLKDNIESGRINKCYCPMARDNQGASWFTTEEEINNPYFGDKMLKCGRITETIE